MTIRLCTFGRLTLTMEEISTLEIIVVKYVKKPVENTPYFKILRNTWNTAPFCGFKKKFYDVKFCPNTHVFLAINVFAKYVYKFWYKFW